MRTGGALLLALLGALALVSCGQLAPDSSHDDHCNANHPHECCGFGTPYYGLSCEQDYGRAVCGSEGWICTLGSPAYGCSSLCLQSLDGDVEADAETDATVGGDGTADDETDGVADAAEGTGDGETGGAADAQEGTGDGGCDRDHTPVCCGVTADSDGYSCEFDFGASICGPNGWMCPRGGNPVRACSTICTENPVPTTDASPALDASAPNDASGKE